MRRKYLPYHTPTYQEVEHSLYVAFREDSDALRNHVLPHRVAAGHLVYVCFRDDMIHFTFFRPAPEVVVPKALNVRRELDLLAQHRSCYFGWEGPAVGPVRLDVAQAALLGRYDAHLIAGSIGNKTSVDEPLTKLLNERLYRLKEEVA
jgi:hypothetical protein